jgi:EmrB/QacA subfamily drug resistance transporter
MSAGAGRPARHPLGSKNAALAALCLGALILNVDTTIVTVALPDLVRQTGATTTDLQWVVDAYSLAFGALVLAAGSLSDRLGRKGMLLAGIAVFGAASVAGSQAGSAAGLIGARAAMGVGAAMIYPSTLSLITSVFTGRRERAWAIGLWGACAGTGVAVGPIAGGWLLERFWWGSIFAAMAVLAVVVAVGVAAAVPTSRDPATPPVDRRGLVLSAAGMGVLVFGVIEAPGWGWSSGSTAAVIAAGVAVLAIMAVAESRTAHPMIDVSLFRNPRFTAACGAVAMALFALLGFIFLMTQYFQVVKSYSPLSTGVRLLPLAAAVMVTSVAGTRLAVRVGNKVIISTGLALFGLAMFWTSRESQATPYAIMVAQEVILGAGLGLTQAPTADEALSAVPVEKVGLASAINGSTRLFGGTLGVAVIGSVASSLYASRLLGTLPPGLPASVVATAKGSVGGAALAARQLRAAGAHSAARGLDAAAVQAFLHGLAYGCAVAGGVAAVGFVVAVVALPGRPRADLTSANRGVSTTFMLDQAANRDGIESSGTHPGQQHPSALVVTSRKLIIDR